MLSGLTISATAKNEVGDFEPAEFAGEAGMFEDGEYASVGR